MIGGIVLPFCKGGVQGGLGGVEEWGVGELLNPMVVSVNVKPNG